MANIEVTPTVAALPKTETVEVVKAEETNPEQEVTVAPPKEHVETEVLKTDSVAAPEEPANDDLSADQEPAATEPEVVVAAVETIEIVDNEIVVVVQEVVIETKDAAVEVAVAEEDVKESESVTANVATSEKASDEEEKPAEVIVDASAEIPAEKPRNRKK